VTTELDRLRRELAQERAARAQAEARVRDVELELRSVTDELRRNVSAFQEMALRHQDALVRLAGLSPDGGGLAPLEREIARVAAETIGVERASVWHLNPEATELRCEEIYERGPDRYSSGFVLAAADYPRYFEALKLGRAIDGHDARNDPRTSEFTTGYLEPLGITSMLDAAIRRGGEVVGVVCLEHVGPKRTWSAAEMEFAGALADQAALALATVERRALEEERAQFTSELMQTRELALRDPLTGLANRRALEVMLAEEVARSARHARPLSILMADVDHFKQINDLYGHAAGDTVLRQLASLLAQELRSIDKAARYGGEELLVLLPETPLAEARMVAERVRLAIEGHTFVVDPEDDEPPVALRLTLSLGVAAIPETAATLQRLVEVADRALYHAKHEGRNRVAVAEVEQTDATTPARSPLPSDALTPPPLDPGDAHPGHSPTA
jgi:two-component system cell cycle response regulator